MTGYMVSVLGDESDPGWRKVLKVRVFGDKDQAERARRAYEDAGQMCGKVKQVKVA